jgi:hypothetical protein
MLASAAFSQIDVLGYREATAHLTDHAVRHGVAAALPAEVGTSVRGRGEWSGAEPLRMIVRVIAQRTARRLTAAG